MSILVSIYHHGVKLTHGQYVYYVDALLACLHYQPTRQSWHRCHDVIYDNHGDIYQSIHPVTLLYNRIYSSTSIRVLLVLCRP